MSAAGSQQRIAAAEPALAHVGTLASLFEELTCSTMMCIASIGTIGGKGGEGGGDGGDDLLHQRHSSIL